MTLKVFGLGFFAALFGICSVASAQPVKKVPTIGVLLPDTALAYASNVDAFVQGLRQFGYVVDQNIRIEYRYADGKRERFGELAGELARIKVDVILVVGGTLDAANRATRTIPIVVATA